MIQMTGTGKCRRDVEEDGSPRLRELKSPTLRSED
jgi:hypothetical protein